MNETTEVSGKPQEGPNFRRIGWFRPFSHSLDFVRVNSDAISTDYVAKELEFPEVEFTFGQLSI